MEAGMIDTDIIGKSKAKIAKLVVSISVKKRWTNKILIGLAAQ